MVQIDYYFSLLSPFTYFAGTRLESVAARHAAPIRYKPMDIMKVFAATGGVAVKDRHPSRQAYRLQELRRHAKRLEMPINERPAHFPTDAAPASRALIAAQEAGFSVGLAAHGFLKAVWAEEKNIADPAVVSDMLAAHGVAESALGEHAETAARLFDENTQQAIDVGVFGSPFYVVGDELFWGQDRMEHLAAHLADVSA